MTNANIDQRLEIKTTMFEAAIGMACKGMRIFPCGADKQPLTAHGFKDASNDEAVIRDWWTRWPDAGIGMPTGKINGDIVLDVDMDRERGIDGEAALQALQTREGAVISTTRTVRTPRGGRHLYFKHPGGAVKNSTSKIGPGLDIKADSGYVIAPPSRNGNGQSYLVETEGPIADLPAWLAKLIVEPVRQPAPTPAHRLDDTPDRAKVEDALRCISANCSFDDWLHIGMALHAWSPTEGRALWDAWSRTVPERYQESAIGQHWRSFKSGAITVATLFKMAIDAGWCPPRKIPEQIAKKAENTAVARPAEVIPEPEPWGTPIGFDAPINLPAFPVAVLPEPFNLFVEDVAASKQAPPDLPGALVIGAVAMAAAKRFRVYIGQSHDEPLNLFSLALMEPGSRKSDIFRVCLAPVENFEIELARDAMPAIARAQERRAIEEVRLTEIRKRAGRCDDIAERQKLTSEAEELGANLTEIPTPPRLVVGDISPEHLASLLCANGGRLAVADAEGGLIFEIMGGRYTKNGGPNMEIFLKGHAGDAVRVDRSGRSSEFARTAALTCILTAQPAILRNLAANDQMRGRGLLARFLFTMPSGLIGARAYANKPMNPQFVEQYAARLYDLLAVPPLNPDDPEAHRRLNLDGEALEVWRTYHDQIEKAQAPDGELSHMTDFASKLAGAVARIAGILHLMKHGAQAPQNIEPATVAGAWALGMFFLEHTKAAFAEMGAGGDMGLARRVYGWISRHRPERFTLGILFNDLRRGAGLDLSDDLLPALGILEDRNIIRREPPPPGDKPGRKSFGSWEVNRKIVSGEII